MADKKMMRVTQVKSKFGRLKSHQDCLRGLGLRRLNHSVEVEDTPSTRGMVNKVAYLIKVEEV
jgi:large subunit ribosomal protein L30